MDNTFETNHIPHSLRQRYASINRRLASKGKQILCFGRRHYCGHGIPPLCLHILLLQHEREVNRPTGTGQLVKPSSTIQPTNRSNIADKQQQQSTWQVSQCTWSGRADNDKIEQYLRQLQDQGRMLVLLWKGAKATSVSSYLGRATTTNPATPIPVTFIVLDGTWQEANKMLRKIPSLPTLPRLSLEARGGPSAYRLRGDYGWKQRFSRNDENDNNQSSSGNDKASSLLCTVEVVAELLEQAGHLDEGMHLRQQLNVFMESFPWYTQQGRNV